MGNIEDNEIWSFNENWVVHCSFFPSHHHHHHHFLNDISYNLMRKICSSTWNWVEIGFSMWINTFCLTYGPVPKKKYNFWLFWLRNHSDIHYNLICSNNFSSVCHVITIPTALRSSFLFVNLIQLCSVSTTLSFLSLHSILIMNKFCQNIIGKFSIW